MERAAAVRRLTYSWRESVSLPTVSARQVMNWLFSLPEGLGIAIAIVATFSVVVVGMAVIYDAPLTWPREHMNVVLGYSSVFPVAGAIFIYALLRLCKMLVSGHDPSAPPLVRLMGTDLTLMGLFLMATYFHFSLKTWVQVINPNLYDNYYFAVDRALRPLIELCYQIRTDYFTAIPNTDTWYQAAFLLMFITGFCSLSIARSPVYPRFCVGVLLTLCLGALSYLIAPAVGPFIFEDGLNAKATAAQANMLWAHEQVEQEGMPWIARMGAAHFTGGLAAMPSLHIAHSMVMTWFIFQARSFLVLVFPFICFWVLVESVASRWHYLIDLPAGALLAVFIIWLTSRLCPLESRTALRQ